MYSAPKNDTFILIVFVVRRIILRGKGLKEKQYCRIRPFQGRRKKKKSLEMLEKKRIK